MYYLIACIGILNIFHDVFTVRIDEDVDNGNDVEVTPLSPVVDGVCASATENVVSVE